MTNTTDNLWFQAAAMGDIGAVRSMIVDGINVNMRDEQGRTAFHIASERGYTDVMTTILAAKKMDYLRQMGIDPYAMPTVDDQSIANENRRSA